VAINLAATLAREGQRVLLVDLDPQAHCAVGMAVAEDQIDLNIYDCLKSRRTSEPLTVDRVTWQIAPNLDLAPSTSDLALFESSEAAAPDADELLKGTLAIAAGAYDLVVVDTPAHLGLLTRNALRAAHDVIVPVDTGFFSLHSLAGQLESLEQLGLGNTTRQTIRVLPNQYDVRTKMAREILAEMRQRFNGLLLDSVINFNTKLKEGTSYGQPITEFAPTSMGARDFQTLAREVISFTKAQAPEQSKFAKRADELAAQANRLLATNKTLFGKGGTVNVVRNQKVASPENTQQKLDIVYGALPTRDGVKFRSPAPDAIEVRIAGDFNGWKPEETPMQKTPDGIYEATLALPPGKYRYNFVVDGQWKPDDYNPTTEKSEKGQIQSIVEVPAI
jgi:chromosome partitioning protein